MKKFNTNSRGHSNGRPHGQPRQSVGNQTNSYSRSSSKKADAKSSQAWLNSSSTPLTSHLPGMTSGNRKKPNFSNGGAHGNQNSPNRNRSNQNGNEKSFQKNNKFQHNKNRRFFKNKQNNRNGANPSSPASDQISPAIGKSTGDPKQIDAFKLFCTYHLGIGPNNTYKPTNINQVAQFFGVEPSAIRQATKEFGFDSESMLNKDFDLALAQLDIQVAPEGISKLELAKGLYEEFLNAPILKRDWKKILEEDKKENAKVFGS